VKLEQLLKAQTPGIVAMEACATSHYWGRFARSFGHEVRLIPPIYVKPFVKRQKMMSPMPQRLLKRRYP